jgi:hypothetical protein
MKTSPVDIGMDDEPREQISELEVQIEELAGALERCRKTALASKAAMAFGGILLAATTLGVVIRDGKAGALFEVRRCEADQTVPRVLDDVPGRREAAAGHHSLPPAGGWKAPTPAQPGLGIRNKDTSVTLGPRVSQAKLSRWLIQHTN